MITRFSLASCEKKQYQGNRESGKEGCRSSATETPISYDHRVVVHTWSDDFKLGALSMFQAELCTILDVDCWHLFSWRGVYTASKESIATYRLLFPPCHRIATHRSGLRRLIPQVTSSSVYFHNTAQRTILSASL